MRSRILGAFEAAELEPDAERGGAWLTFVVVGAGPTGVEMAGQIAELARDTLRHDFRAIDPREARVLLVEATDRVLATFPPSLSRKAERSLEHLGVTPLLQRRSWASTSRRSRSRRPTAHRAHPRAHRRSGPPA